MSCKDEAEREGAALQGQTRTALAQADAAQRCIRPGCEQPIARGGTVCGCGHPQGLAAVEQGRGQRERGKLLLAAIPTLGAEDVPAALDLALSLGQPQRALRALRRRFPHAYGDYMQEQALQLCRRETGDYGLQRLAPYLPPDALHTAVEASGKYSGTLSLPKALKILAPYLVGDLQDVVVARIVTYAAPARQPQPEESPAYTEWGAQLRTFTEQTTALAALGPHLEGRRMRAALAILTRRPPDVPRGLTAAEHTVVSSQGTSYWEHRRLWDAGSFLARAGSQMPAEWVPRAIQLASEVLRYNRNTGMGYPGGGAGLFLHTLAQRPELHETILAVLPQSDLGDDTCGGVLKAMAPCLENDATWVAAHTVALALTPAAAAQARVALAEHVPPSCLTAALQEVASVNPPQQEAYLAALARRTDSGLQGEMVKVSGQLAAAPRATFLAELARLGVESRTRTRLIQVARQLPAGGQVKVYAALGPRLPAAEYPAALAQVQEAGARGDELDAANSLLESVLPQLPPAQYEQALAAVEAVAEAPLWRSTPEQQTRAVAALLPLAGRLPEGLTGRALNLVNRLPPRQQGQLLLALAPRLSSAARAQASTGVPRMALAEQEPALLAAVLAALRVEP